MRTRTKDDLGTPPWLVARVREALGGGIDLDPCSNEWSRVGARVELSIDRDEDGLLYDWTRAKKCTEPGMSDVDFTPHARVFANPPYGRGHLSRWAAKIREEAARCVEIVTLVPMSPDTAWWETLLDSCSARCEVAMRIAFDGGEHGTGQIKSAVFYHGPSRFLFCHAFDTLGECIAYPRRRAA